MNRKIYLFRAVILTLLIICITVSATGHSDRLAATVGMDRVAAANGQYLDDSFDRALKGFLLMSGLKMGLAVVKDSEAGLSLGVTTRLHIGGLVQSAYDYVDIAWKTLLAGSTILLGLEYLLQAVSLIEGPVLTITLLLLFLLLILKWFVPAARRSLRIIRDLSTILVVFTLILYFVLPLSISGGGFLSKYITTPAIIEAEEGIGRISEELFPDKPVSGRGLLDQLKGVKEQIDEVTSSLSERAKELSIYVIKIITGYIFDCIIFPLLLFVLLFLLIKSLVFYIFNVSREDDFSKDLAEMLDGHYEKLRHTLIESWQKQTHSAEKEESGPV